MAQYDSRRRWIPSSTQKTVAPYGTWSSPISAEMVAQAGVRPHAPWIEDGVVWWLEGRASESGRVVLVRPTRTVRRVDVVPAGFNVRTSVHEYGGGAYCIHARTSRSSPTSTTSASIASSRARAPVPITPAVEGTASPVRRRSRHARRATLDRGPRAARGERALEGRRQRARRAPDRRLGRAARDRERAGTSTRIRASRPTDHGSASWPGICRGCRGTGVSCTSPISRRTAS